MSYIDGFVTPVLSDKKSEYVAHAQYASQIFKDYGAVRVTECWGDDVPEGKQTSFTMAVQRTENETTVFSWVEWPSKEVRDAAWEKIMADERMQKMMGEEMPFDGKRMIYGGFAMVVDA